MVLGQDVVAQGGLDVEQGDERQAGEASVLLVLDLAIGGIAKGGAQDADGIFPVALDFEVDGVVIFDGYRKALIHKLHKNNNFQCMATLEMKNRNESYGGKQKS